MSYKWSFNIKYWIFLTQSCVFWKRGVNMLGIRYEEYSNISEDLPVVIFDGIERDLQNYSREQNWHENIEIQFCTQGRGTVILNGASYDFEKDDVAVVSTDVIHYTSGKSSLTYGAVIVSTEFCKEYGINYEKLKFTPVIKNKELATLIKKLTEEYFNKNTSLKKARITSVLLDIMVILCTQYSTEEGGSFSKEKAYEVVKKAVVYIRKNFADKITLDVLSKEILYDKYALCRAFKRFTGHTVIEYANHYRCMVAAEYLKDGVSVADTARRCGFENLSFFTRTFKKFYGTLPSKYKKHNNV